MKQRSAFPTMRREKIFKIVSESKPRMVKQDDKSESNSNSTKSLKLNVHDNLVYNKGNTYSGYLLYMNLREDKNQLKTLTVILRNKCLYYFNDSGKAEGMISLVNCLLCKQGIKTFNGALFFLFSIHFISSEFLFYCTSEEYYLKWISNIERTLALTENKKSEISSFFYLPEIENSRIEDYSLLEVLSKSRNTVVYRGFHKHHNIGQLVVKTYRKSKLRSSDFLLIRREINILKYLSFFNSGLSVRYIQDFEDPNYIYIVQEFYKGITLKEYIDRRSGEYNEPAIKRILYELLLVIEFIHNHGIVHRDIKPTNILVIKEHHFKGESIRIKLLDFGLSREVGVYEKISNEPFGTLKYSAPEILLNKEYCKSIDLFSFGVIAYLLITGKLPFDGYSEEEIAMKIARCEPSYENRNFSNESIHFCKRVLTAKARATIKELKNHPWLTRLAR